VSPLSRATTRIPFITDRFEFFIGGRELANGFSELNDPRTRRSASAPRSSARTAGDEEAMYYDADYVRALEYGMPPTGGLGVGVDRLVMFFTDSPSIRDVLLFPHMRGWTDGEIPQAVARRYLRPLFSGSDVPDTLVLGCTHFPVLAGAIRAVLRPGVAVVDSAETSAAALLREVAPRPAGGSPGRVSWLATDDAARFARVGSQFLGEEMHAGDIEIVDLAAGVRR
jgi:hypothetical protein